MKLLYDSLLLLSINIIDKYINNDKFIAFLWLGNVFRYLSADICPRDKYASVFSSQNEAMVFNILQNILYNSDVQF